MGILPASSKKLSICIPTYNRSKYLDRCLSILIPQVQRFPDDVEIVISDNCSTDDTKDVVARYSQDCLIRYSRNQSNLGLCGNVLRCISTLAEGEFCWVIGDDDIPRDGSVAKMVQIIKANPDIDFIHVNFILDIVPPTARDQTYVGVLTDQVTKGSVGTMDLKERTINRWEELLEEDEFFLTAIYSGISRLSVVREESRKIHIEKDFENIESSFPHTVVYIRTMVGKKAYSTGVPWVICGTKSSWPKHGLVVSLRTYQTIQYQRQYEIPSSIIEHQILRYVEGNSIAAMDGLLRSRMDMKDTPFASQFSIFSFLLEFIPYREFRKKLMKYVVVAVRKKTRKCPFIK